ncbi:unnamed protein product [Hydatigera taeniaeformis]|uniref:Secreted protein n=1 Tax=Hydatigena taeniaeformis TaxID=6205 RepID=A0A0R3XDB2_HYDTA|nr:unnamed protein product [Hydatigera taeniaeformis]
MMCSAAFTQATVASTKASPDLMQSLHWASAPLVLEGRSVEDEIVRQSHSDIATIVISYTIMVVYVSICLGNYRGLRTCLSLLLLAVVLAPQDDRKLATGQKKADAMRKEK